MQIIDVFSGIGGFSYAGKLMGWRTIQFCEIDRFCQKILSYHWPGVPIHDNIKTLTADQIKNNPLYDESETTIFVGGVPCQPWSVAGKRLGKADDRDLWEETIKLVGQVKPDWCLLENVRGLVNWSGGLVFEQVQADLEAQGYEVLPFILPACAVNAPHRRDRVWFVAHALRSGYGGRTEKRRSDQPKEWQVYKDFRQHGDGVRSETERCSKATENAMHSGRIQRKFEQEGAEIREQRDISAGGTERVCVSEGFDPNSNSPGLQTTGAEQSATGTAGGGVQRPTADTDSQRHTPCGKSEEPERSRCGNNGKQEERIEQAERVDGLYGFQRPTSNTTSERSERSELGGQPETGSKEQGKLGRSSGEDVVTDTNGFGLRGESNGVGESGQFSEESARNNWQNFPTQSPLHRRDDGIPRKLPIFVVNDVRYAISKTSKENRIENLQEVWDRVSSPEVWEKVRRLYSLESKDLLFQVMQLYSTDTQAPVKLSPFSEEISKDPLRTLQKHGQFRNSPQGQRLEKQRSEQFADSLSFLPHEVALAAMAYTDSIRKFEAWHRKESIKAHGNAVVPPLVLEIFKAIEAYENLSNNE